MNIFMDNVTQIRSAQHILHFSLPTQDFRKFLMRFSAMMDFYNEHDSKPGVSDTAFFFSHCQITFKSLIVPLNVTEFEWAKSHIDDVH